MPYVAHCPRQHSLRGPRLTKPARTSTSPTSATATTSTSRVVHHLTTSVDFSKRSSRPFFDSRSSMTFSSSSSSTAHAVPTGPGPSRPPQTSDPPMFIAIIRQVLSPALTPVLRDAVCRLVRRRPCQNIQILVFDSHGIPDSFSLRSLPACCSNS